MNNKNPYKIPDGYFSEMQARVDAQVGLPAHDSTGYDIPEDYFNDLQAQVLKKVDHGTKVINIWSWYKVGAAASVALLLCSVLWLWPNIEATPDMADLLLQEPDLLIDAMGDDITYDQLAELVTADELADIAEDLDTDYIDIQEDMDIYELQELY